MSRMETQCISIPGESPADKAADIVIAALRENGMDPRAAGNNPAMQAICQAWARGEMDRDGFNRCCRNVLILNPGLESGRKG